MLSQLYPITIWYKQTITLYRYIYIYINFHLAHMENKHIIQ